MKFLLGKKLGMTQIFKEDKAIPVTLIESGPNFVTQIKNKDKDGYAAVQVGFGVKKVPLRGISRREKKNISAKGGSTVGGKKPKTDHPKNLPKLRWLREFRVENPEIKIGDQINVSTFSVGNKVNVIAISKGKGFQGVVKRHGFHGGPKSHGQKDRHRAPGSIGTSFPEHVIKGKKMAGRMGGDRVTVKNLEVIEVDGENNLIALKGAVPGRRGTLIMINKN